MKFQHLSTSSDKWYEISFISAMPYTEPVVQYYCHCMEIKLVFIKMCLNLGYTCEQFILINICHGSSLVSKCMSQVEYSCCHMCVIYVQYSLHRKYT